MQEHKHHVKQNAVSISINAQGQGITMPMTTDGGVVWTWDSTEPKNCRIGNVTRGKRKGVKYIIKVL